MNLFVTHRNNTHEPNFMVRWTATVLVTPRDPRPRCTVMIGVLHISTYFSTRILDQSPILGQGQFVMHSLQFIIH